MPTKCCWLVNTPQIHYHSQALLGSTPFGTWKNETFIRRGDVSWFCYTILSWTSRATYRACNYKLFVIISSHYFPTFSIFAVSRIFLFIPTFRSSRIALKVAYTYVAEVDPCTVIRKGRSHLEDDGLDGIGTAPTLSTVEKRNILVPLHIIHVYTLTPMSFESD